MKLLAWLAVASSVAVTVIACSQSPAPRPPIETSGGNGQGASPGAAGGAAPTSDAGAASDGGSTVIANEDGSVEGGECNATNCNGGCCTPLNTCDHGTTNTSCGIFAAACIACPAGTNCTNGSCF